MKLILTGVLLSLALLGSVLAQNYVIKASFLGYDTEFNIYSFETEDGNYLDFGAVSSELVKKYGLSENSNRDKAFVVEYKVNEVEDEEGDVYEEFVLLKMTPTTIVKNKEEELDEDF